MQNESHTNLIIFSITVSVVQLDGRDDSELPDDTELRLGFVFGLNPTAFDESTDEDWDVLKSYTSLFTCIFELSNKPSDSISFALLISAISNNPESLSLGASLLITIL